MLRPAPDTEVFRSGLARELATVTARPGGWQRVRAGLAAGPPVPARRWGRMLLLVPFVAAALLAGAATAQTRAVSGQQAEAPIVTVCGALVAIVTTGAVSNLCEDGRLVLRARARQT